MFVTENGAIMHFNSMFGLLVMLYITPMMTVAAVETIW